MTDILQYEKPTEYESDRGQRNFEAVHNGYGAVPAIRRGPFYMANRTEQVHTTVIVLPYGYFRSPINQLSNVKKIDYMNLRMPVICYIGGR